MASQPPLAQVGRGGCGHQLVRFKWLNQFRKFSHHHHHHKPQRQHPSTVVKCKRDIMILCSSHQVEVTSPVRSNAYSSILSKSLLETWWLVWHRNAAYQRMVKGSIWNIIYGLWGSIGGERSILSGSFCSKIASKAIAVAKQFYLVDQEYIIRISTQHQRFRSMNENSYFCIRNYVHSQLHFIEEWQWMYDNDHLSRILLKSTVVMRPPQITFLFVSKW